jgi:hypothetical protein
MDPEGNGGRDGITITCFLASIFYQMEAQSNLPRVQYVTLIETYIFVYCVIVGFSCIVFAYVTNVFREDLNYDKLCDLAPDVDKNDLHEVSRLLAQEDAVHENQHELDVAEQLWAVKVDQTCRIGIPIVTGVFNAFCLLWVAFEPWFYPDDINTVFGY